MAKADSKLGDGLSGREARDKIIIDMMSRIDEDDPNSAPWRSPSILIPQVNAVTRKPYRGVNRWVVAERLTQMGGSADSRWFSWGQIRGHQREAWAAHQKKIDDGTAPADEKPNSLFVRKGESGTRVIFARKVDVRMGSGTSERSNASGKSTDNASSLSDRLAQQSESRVDTASGGEGAATRSYFCLRKFAVWHASQLENVPAIELPRLFSPSDKARMAHDALCDLAQRMGVSLLTNPSQTPHYRPGQSLAVMPPASSFADEYGYVSTLAHELAHASGDAGRMERPGITRARANGTVAKIDLKASQMVYAQEELVAELSSALMCAALGFAYDLGDNEYSSQHAAYLKTWKALALDSPTTIAVAMAQAERVLNYAIQQSPLFALAAESHGFAQDAAVAGELRRLPGAAIDHDAVTVGADGDIESDPDEELSLEFLDELPQVEFAGGSDFMLEAVASVAVAASASVERRSTDIYELGL